MMSKAEERALEAYPKMSRITEPHGVIPADYESHYIGDANEEKRMGFIEGYHQAEEDLELSWEDVKMLQDISSTVYAEIAQGNVDYYQIYPTEQSFLEEVLKRFKEEKKKIDN